MKFHILIVTLLLVALTTTAFIFFMPPLTHRGRIHRLVQMASHPVTKVEKSKTGIYLEFGAINSRTKFLYYDVTVRLFGSSADYTVAELKEAGAILASNSWYNPYAEILATTK